jgi:SWI/SNF-related matrix-associated actin-dependent regulator of chromatin subfamily A-like protein 1
MENEILFPYQLEGAQWLSERKLALLADEMGVGKTAQVIRACDIIGAERILVLCPAVARINWTREFNRFSKQPRNFSLVMESRHSQKLLNLTVCSYDLATICHRKNLELLSKESWDLLILDEAHYLKSPNAIRTKAVFGKTGLIRKSKRCWALTGTPAPNNPSELWVMLYTFGITNLRYDDFVERFCNGFQGARGFQITGAKTSHIPELRGLLSKIMLRRKKEKVMKELPPIHFDHVTVEPGPVDLDTDPWFVDYVFPEDRREELKKKLDHENTILKNVLEASHMGADGIKVLEAVSKSLSTLRRYTGLQKLKAVTELVTEEMTEGYYDKLVIFAIHVSIIEGLRLSLRKFNPVVLYGGTPAEKRQKRIDKFQHNPKCKIFIGNIQACGTAISLTASNQVLFVESDWTPAYNSQAAMRCHRIGQDKPVFVRFVGLADSLDEKINQVLKRKTRDLTAIFDAPLQPHEAQCVKN